MRLGVIGFAIALAAAQTAVAADHVWLVPGAGGEPPYTGQFNGTLESIRASLIGRHHYDPDRVRILGATESAPDRVEREVTLEEFEAAWSSLIETLTPEDTFLLVLIGHGQSDFVEPKFNLAGPDLTGQALAAMTAALPAAEKRVILSFPCSGHFSELLAPIPGVSVIASTDGPRQIFLSVMNGFLVKAFEDEWSDQDGDGALTFYELFEYLSNEVDDYYQNQDFIQTSNVSLEDNGDGRVTTFAEGMDAGDGDTARERRVCPAPAYVKTAEVLEEAES